MRTLRNAKEFEHAAKMSELEAEYNRLLPIFLAKYPTLYDQAQGELKGLYDVRSWPDPRKIERKFSWSIRIMTPPAGADWSEWLGEVAEIACDNVRTKIYDALDRLRTCCGNLDGRLYKTVFTNLKELVEMIPDLDIEINSDLARLGDQVRELGEIDAEDIKDNETARLEAAQRAGDVLDMFGTGSLS
jgi:hypothetical protein